MLEKCLSAANYVVHLYWINDLVSWMLIVAGNVAKSAFTLGTLWVTALVVASPLLNWLLGGEIIGTINQMVMLSFSWLPELILCSAIIHVFNLWVRFSLQKNIASALWASAFSIPTGAFVIITLLTIQFFIGQKDLAHMDTVQLDGVQLSIRVFAGWIYGTLSMLHSRVGTSVTEKVRNYGTGRVGNKRAQKVTAVVKSTQGATQVTGANGNMQPTQTLPNALDRKSLLVEKVLRNGQSITSACKELGVSRKTGGKWVRDVGIQAGNNTVDNLPDNVTPLPERDETAM